MTIERLWVRALVIAPAAVTVLGGAAQAGPTLDKVKQKRPAGLRRADRHRRLGMPDSQGRYAGFNIDIWRALSAAISAPPTKSNMCR